MVAYPRELLERLERASFDVRSDEDEIFERLHDLSVEELEDSSVRELEVLARNTLSEEWDVDSDLAEKPMTIHKKGLNPAASFEDWQINIPKATPTWSILQLWDRYVPDKVERSPYLDSDSLDTSMVEDVFHEVGHNLNSIADGFSGYETLEEYMFHEAIAMAAVLEFVDEPSEYYGSIESEVIDLAEESPEEHIDLVLEHRENYLEALDNSLELLGDINFKNTDHFELNRDLGDFNRKLNDLRDERDLLTYTHLDMSVKDQFEQDIFGFQRLLNIGTEAHELSPVSSPEDSEYNFMIQTGALDSRERLFGLAGKQPKSKVAEIKRDFDSVLNHIPLVRGFDSEFDQVYEFSPVDLRDYLQDHIKETIEVTENLTRRDLEEYRQNMINSRLENFGLPGHSLGYELGRRIRENDEYDVSEVVSMPEEEAIEYLRPLMNRSQEDLEINLPLDLNIEYHSLENEIEKKDIYEICDY